MMHCATWSVGESEKHMGQFVLDSKHCQPGLKKDVAVLECLNLKMVVAGEMMNLC